MGEMNFRDLNVFLAGEVHNHVGAWDVILQGYESREAIFKFICSEVRVLDYLNPFKGVLNGVHYDSNAPPKDAFLNHSSCKGFENFISREIRSRILTAAVKVWGKVSVSERPWLVLPLTAEPCKPRLCARFLNLCMADTPISLDKLAEVPRFVTWSHFMTKLDDEAGYYHNLLTEESRTYVGFEWDGW